MNTTSPVIGARRRAGSLRKSASGCLLIIMLTVGVINPSLGQQSTGSPATSAAATGDQAEQSEQQEDLWLTVRILPTVKVETLKLLADVTIPETRGVAQGENLRTLLKAKYGSYDEKVYNLFRAYNPQITSLVAPTDMDVVLPAGPRWMLFTINRLYPVGTTYEEIAARETGSADKSIIKAIKDLTAALAKESPQNDSPLLKRVAIPFSTKYVSYRLRPEFAARAEAILAQLASDPAVVQKEVARATRLKPTAAPSASPQPTPESPIIDIKPDSHIETIIPPVETPAPPPPSQPAPDIFMSAEIQTRAASRTAGVPSARSAATQAARSLPSISVTAPPQHSSSSAVALPAESVIGAPTASIIGAGDDSHPEMPAPNWCAASIGITRISGNDLQGVTSGSEVVVAVLDSGIGKDGDEPDKRFVYWHNAEEEGGIPGFDDDDNDCVDDIIGCSMFDHGFPKDDLEIPKLLNHGTHVAGLASGRLFGDPVLGAINSRVKLMVLKVTDAAGVIPPGPVADALLYAGNKQAAIVNMSFDIPVSESILTNMRNNPNSLYVLAAGNGRDDKGINVDMDVLFIKKIVTKLNNVITVAAHDPDGHLLTSSNYGANTVDIAAPGQEIESTIVGGQTFKLSGTSQAAPLVSLAAALLRAEGLTTPQEIRARLIGSVDFVPELQGKIFSEGKLNIAKAIDIKNDQVEIQEVNSETGAVTRRVLRGKIVSPEVLQIPPVPIPLRAVRKIVFGYPTPQGVRQRVIRMEGQRLTATVLDLGIQSITIQIGNELREVPVEQIVDVIPASRN